MTQFVERQIELLGERRALQCGGSKERAKPARGLWLDSGHWLAWTMDGELVCVEVIEPGSARGSPEVRRLEGHEMPEVFAVDRLIPSVIALYRGDRLDRGPVWRYIVHHDLRGALGAALARARTEDARLLEPTAPVDSDAAVPERPRVGRAQKTRHHPLGNFIVFRRPGSQEGLPRFAAVLQLPPVPEAFPSRRAAVRYLARMPRLQIDPTGLVVARVLGCVEVEPVWRPGIRVPRDPAAIIAMLRKEPRVAQPVLRAAWLPRFEQGDDGGWQLRSTRKRGTIRGRRARQLLQKVAEAGRGVVALLDDNEIRLHTGAEELPVAEQLARSLSVVQQAERRLPAAWRDQLGLQRESIGPEWRRLRAAAQISDTGHWLRAPCEHGRPHVDGQRRRIVELQIDDLAGLLEVAGMRPRFLLVKCSTSTDPEWRCVVGAAEAYEP